MKRYNFWLHPDKQVAKLQKLADKTGISLSEIVRRAIDDFIQKKGF
jgi:predicted transcriptional regulator